MFLFLKDKIRMGFLTLYLPSLTETKKKIIDKYAEEACFSLANKIKSKGSVQPDDYNELLREYDGWFMKKIGIADRDSFIIYHVLHWVLVDSGMKCEFFVGSDKRRDKSRIYGDGIERGLVPGNLEKYKPVVHGKVRKALCHE